MPLPALAIPIGMGIAAAGGAIARASAAKKQAEAMMPDAYRRRLEELEARERAGELGLTEPQRAMMETDAAAARAAVTADQRAQQLQRAQSQSAGFAGRDLFLSDIAQQQTQAQMLSQQQRAIDAANEQARQQQEMMLMELQQREADAEAGRKAANRQLVADLFGVAASTAGTAYTSTQMAKANTSMLDALARGDQTAARNAMNAQFYGQMGMQMASAFGPSPVAPAAPVPVVPYPAPGAIDPRFLPVGPAPDPNRPRGVPTLVGYDVNGAPIYSSY